MTISPPIAPIKPVTPMQPNPMEMSPSPPSEINKPAEPPKTLDTTIADTQTKIENTAKPALTQVLEGQEPSTITQTDLQDARPGLEEIVNPTTEIPPAIEPPVIEPPITPTPSSTETTTQPVAETTPQPEENVQLTPADLQLYSSLIDSAQQMFLEHKHLWTLNKPTADDVMGLMEVALAKTKYGPSATIDLIEQMKKNKKELPAGTEELKQKLQIIAQQQEQQLIELAKEHQLLTDADIDLIGKGDKNAFDQIMNRIGSDLKNKGTNTGKFLREPDIFGDKFKLNLQGILEVSGAWPDNEIEQYKLLTIFQTVYKDQTTPLNDKIKEKAGKWGKVGGGGLLMMLFLMVQTASQGEGGGR